MIMLTATRSVSDQVKLDSETKHLGRAIKIGLQANSLNALSAAFSYRPCFYCQDFDCTDPS